MFLAMIIGAGALLGGFFLLGGGVRGGPGDDHPVCRKCGFDLFGRPEGTFTGRCSECGMDLAKKRAVRMGNRRKRGRILGAGALVTAVGVMGLGSMGWITARGIDVNHYKPV